MTVMTAIRSAETEEAKGAADRIGQARALLPNDPELLRFFDALYASAMPDDVLRARADQLAALALAVHAETAKRAPGAIHVVALDQSQETVLVGINDDLPFLFDSSLQAVMAGGGRKSAAFHPVVEMKRGLASVISLVFVSMASEAREKIIASPRA